MGPPLWPLLSHSLLLILMLIIHSGLRDPMLFMLTMNQVIITREMLMLMVMDMVMDIVTGHTDIIIMDMATDHTDIMDMAMVIMVIMDMVMVMVMAIMVTFMESKIHVCIKHCIISLPNTYVYIHLQNILKDS